MNDGQLPTKVFVHLAPPWNFSSVMPAQAGIQFSECES